MKPSKYLPLLLIGPLIGVLVFKGLKSEADQPKEVSGKKQAAGASLDAAVPSARQDRTPKRKDTRDDRLRQEEVRQCLSDANSLFRKREIPGALELLNRADEISGPNGEVLNLRGSCYMETRDFEKALPDFEKAVELSKGNPSIRFNVGEVHFVTKRWQEALDVFGKLNEHLPSGNTRLTSLVDFKAMLCMNKLGRVEEMKALAAKYGEQDSSPFYWYASALAAAEANDPQTERKLIFQASQKFPDRGELAPWIDTMNEYRRD